MRAHHGVSRRSYLVPLILGLLVSSLLLSGCVPGDTAPGDGAASPGSPPLGSASTPSPSVRDRSGTDNSPATPRSDFKLPSSSGTINPNSAGMLQKKIGELAGVVASENSNIRLVNFSVASIKADYQCKVPGPVKPSNGHFIAVELWIETTAELSTSKDPYFGVSAKDFDLQSSDGNKVTATLDTYPAHACLDNELGLPARIGPSQKIRGLLVLDSPISSGSLILSQKNTDGPGWIWQF
ncbi:hypothetical protein [Psychromicrobium lacuslunae]|uniref:hypothetical protein n=1 Tax=Psychromicrobium lacuslunae TaxID=1618207 RepID=UPI000B0339BB|nr:hypothetical protein [Psychromicrobium lacuslunae]